MCAATAATAAAAAADDDDAAAADADAAADAAAAAPAHGERAAPLDSPWLRALHGDARGRADICGALAHARALIEDLAAQEARVLENMCARGGGGD
jgi:hypothetical protein